MSIYYLMSSLPILEFGSKLPLSSDVFLGECQHWLTGGQYEIIRQVMKSDAVATSQKTLRLWRAFYESLTNEAVWLRASELNIDPQEFLSAQPQQADPVVIDVLVAALKAGDPLTAQQMIDRLCWQKLDELELRHFFDLDQVIVYGLKLKILERYGEIASNKGRVKFDELKADAALKY